MDDIPEQTKMQPSDNYKYQSDLKLTIKSKIKSEIITLKIHKLIIKSEINFK